jgi:hypothetical protein
MKRLFPVGFPDHGKETRQRLARFPPRWGASFVGEASPTNVASGDPPSNVFQSRQRDKTGETRAATPNS